MNTELIAHLEKIHRFQKTDFRWKNLRTLVSGYVKGPRVLDAGCGTGHLSLELLESGYHVTAVDASEELVSFAQKTIRDAQYTADVFSGDLTELDKTGLPPFDTIICLDVIEHIEHDDRALSTLNNLLKPGGTLIISVPAVKRLYGARDQKIGHYRRYDRKEFMDLLARAGFSATSVRFWNFAGVLPTILAEKVWHRQVDETIRYDRSSLRAKIVHPLLNWWFSIMENRVCFPVGLTLIAVCRKP